MTELSNRLKIMSSSVSNLTKKLWREESYAMCVWNVWVFKAMGGVVSY